MTTPREQPLTESLPPGTAPRSARFGRRLLRLILALAILTLFAACATGLGFRVWFTRQLDHARTELARGHNAAAVRYLQKCQRYRPDDREVLLLSSRAARKSGATDEAEFLLDRATLLYGDDPELVTERLYLRVSRGEIESVGVTVLARIREGGTDTALAREALITGLVTRFRWTEATKHLNDWLAIDPQATAALLLRGKLEEQRLAFGPAKETYQAIVDRDPEHDEARLRLTTLLLADRRGNEALPHLEILRQRLPDLPEVMVQWSRALASVGRVEESRTALLQCLEKHPNFAPALAERGSQLLVEGDEPEAERFLAKAVALDPGNVVARNQYSLALSRNNKRDLAAREEESIAALKTDLDRIGDLISGPLQARPNDPQVHYDIAQIALRSGQVREALQWFTSAIRVDPNHTPTHRVLATLYHELDNPVLAARHRALAQRGGTPPAKP